MALGAQGHGSYWDFEHLGCFTQPPIPGFGPGAWREVRPLVQGSLCQPCRESEEAATWLSARKETKGVRLSPSFSNNVP